MIIATHYEEPTTPIDGAFPDAVREKIGNVWVDYVGEAPTVELRNLAIDKRWHDIKAERDMRKSGGVKVKVGTTNKWFHSDDASRIQQIGLMMMGVNIPVGLQWKTLDDSFVTMTQTVAENIFSASSASDQFIFSVAEMHKSAMESSENPLVYDFSTGWPKIYGE